MSETRFEVDGVSYSAVPTDELDKLKTTVATSIATATTAPPVAKRTFTAEQRRELAAKGQALRDGSYPIIDAASLRSAIQLVGRGNVSTAAVKAHIIRRAKALGLTNLLPDDWNVQKAADALTAELLESLLTDQVAKHFLGKHNQRNHGHRRSGGGGHLRSSHGRMRQQRMNTRRQGRVENRAMSRGLKFKSRRTGLLTREDDISREGQKIGSVNYTNLPLKSAGVGLTVPLGGGSVRIGAPNVVLINKISTTSAAKPGDGGRVVQRALNRSGGGHPMLHRSLRNDPTAKRAIEEWKGRTRWQKMAPKERAAYVMRGAVAVTVAAGLGGQAMRAAHGVGAFAGAATMQAGRATRGPREAAGRRFGPPGKATVNVRGTSRRKPAGSLPSGLSKAFSAELEASLTVEVHKHGRHNQKAHGRRGRAAGAGGGERDPEAAARTRRRVLAVAGAVVALGTVAGLAASKDTRKQQATEDLVKQWVVGKVKEQAKEHREGRSIYDYATGGQRKSLDQFDAEVSRKGGSRPPRYGWKQPPRPIISRMVQVEPILDRFGVNGDDNLQKAIDTPHRKQAARKILRLWTDMDRDYARWLTATGRPDTPESVAEFARAVGGEEVSKSALPVVKAEAHRRFTLAPLYIPDKLDAHAEHTDADTLQKAVWGLIRKGDRSLRLQHDTSITAGEIVEVVSWPYAVEATLSTPDSVSKAARTVTLPPGTVYLGTIWEPWAWKMVLDGKVRGYSMGGTAKRIEVDLPSPKAPA